MLPIINSITIDRKLQSCFELVMPKILDKGCVLEDQVSLLRTVLIEVHLMRFAMFCQTGDLAPAKVLAEVLVIGVVVKVMLQGAGAVDTAHTPYTQRTWGPSLIQAKAS